MPPDFLNYQGPKIHRRRGIPGKLFVWALLGIFLSIIAIYFLLIRFLIFR